MVREKDPPCSECGAKLVECAVDARELSNASPVEDFVTIAECPDCGARYFPDRTLSGLARAVGEAQIDGGR